MARKVILSSGNYSTDDAAKSFFTNSENIAGDALFSFDSTNEALYGNKGDGEVIKISSDKMNENKFATKTYVDEKITVTGVKDGEKVISLDGKELSSTLSLQYDEDNKKIRLIGIDNVTVGDEIDASNFLKGGMIKSANLVEIKKDEDGTYYYEESDGTKVTASGVSEEGTYIKFVFDTTDTDNTLFINVSSLIDTYKAGEGIKISDYEISADTDVLAKKTDIPSVGDAKVIVKQNGTEKGTFTLNQSGEDITIELTDNDTQVTVDEQLDKESTNPVQNKVIYESLDKKVSSVSGEGCVAVTTDTADTTALTVSLNYDSESGDSGDVKFAVDKEGNLTGTVEGWDDKANASDIITYKADDKTISATTSEDKKTVTFNAIIDTAITSDSTNSVTSKAIYDELAEKADKTHTHNASEIDGLAHIADAGYTSTNVKDAILEIEEKVKNAASGNGEINAINKITVNGAEASIANTIAEITIPITKISVNGNEQKIDTEAHSVDITVPMDAAKVTFDTDKHYKKGDETTSSYTGTNVETSITDVEKAITTLEDKVDNLSLGETNVIEHIKVNGGNELTPDSGKTVDITIDASGVTFNGEHYKKDGETTSDYSGKNVQESIVALEEALDGVVSEGGQPNKLEKININKSDIEIGDGKTANVTIKVNNDDTLAEVANNVVNLKVDAAKVTFNSDSHSSTAYTGTNVETSITDVEKAITTLDKKVSGLTPGDKNVIETVKVNGTKLEVTDKAVNVTMDASGVTFDKGKHVDTGYTGESVEASIVEIEQSILDNEVACSEGINDLDTRLKNLVIPTKLSDLTIDQEVTATVSSTTGTPAVTVNKYGDGTLEFAFSNLKGDSGEAAGFGEINASAETLASTEEATVTVTTGGTNAAKDITFKFGIPKGQDGTSGSGSATYSGTSPINVSGTTISLAYDSGNTSDGWVTFENYKGALAGQVNGWKEYKADGTTISATTSDSGKTVTFTAKPDTAITSDSTNSVTSKAIYDALGGKVSSVSGTGCINVTTGITPTVSLNYDSESGASGDVKFAVDTKGNLTGTVEGWDDKANASDIITYKADGTTISETTSEDKKTVTFNAIIDTAITSDSTNSVTSKAIYDALANKLDKDSVPSGVSVEEATDTVYLLGASNTSGSLSKALVNADSDTTSVTMDKDGKLYGTGFYETSDENLKDFGDDITVDYDKLKSIPKKYFTWKGKNKLNIGTSAQKVQEVYPELVSSKYETLNVDYSKLSVIALAAIDNLNERLTALETENASLKETIAKLTSSAE